MRMMVLSLAVLATLGLAACNGNGSGSSQSEQASTASAASAAAPLASSVSGTVGVRDPKAHQLSDQAKLTISLVDVDAADQGAEPLAVKTVSPVKSLPVSFSFPIDATKINTADLYAIKAEMTDGIRHYTMPLQAPVLTQGAPATVKIRLVAEPTPGEKMLAAFKAFEKQIGGMKVAQDTSRNSKVSRGWQVFTEPTSGEVRFVKELSDYVDGGFTRTKFAYKNGKPWVVVLSKQASENAQPSEVDRAGWDITGKLVLRQKEADGKTTQLDAGTAAKLYKDAQAMYKKVSD